MGTLSFAFAQGVGVVLCWLLRCVCGGVIVLVRFVLVMLVAKFGCCALVFSFV